MLQNQAGPHVLGSPARPRIVPELSSLWSDCWTPPWLGSAQRCLAMVLSDVIRTDKEVCLRLFSGCPEHGLGLFHFHEAGKGVLQVAVQLVWQAADDLDFSY